MSDGEVILLGAVAGLTIFLGLPVGRARNLSSATKALFNATATGILLFLLIETTTKSIQPVERALERVTVQSGGTWGTFAGRGFLFVGCFALGLLGLVYYDRWMRGRGEELRMGPGAAAVHEFSLIHRIHSLSEPRRLALFIALGIGLHNFSEGLAIGQSAASDKISLALLLIIGFGAHNATEGFGIVAPLNEEADRPSWGFLTVLGLIGGGPTFVGTVVGQAWVSEWLDIAFLALAAGSILYVIVQLLSVAAKLGHKEMLMWGLLAGVVLGFGTDFILVAAGA
jgi:ZIP family zinc transporter